MDETYTPPTNTNEIEDNFNTTNDWQAEEAAKKARQFIDTPSRAEDPVGWSRGKKIGATLALAGAVGLGAGAATVAVDRFIPGEEVASATSTVYGGEGINASVDRDIEQIESQKIDSQKIDPADTTERQDVRVQAFDIHSDANGIVQPGENVTVIAEKSPIFGNITYKAVENPTPGTDSDVQLPLPPAINTDGTIPSPITH